MENHFDPDIVFKVRTPRADISNLKLTMTCLADTELKLQVLKSKAQEISKNN